MLNGCDRLTEIKLSINFQVDLDDDCDFYDHYNGWYFYGTPVSSMRDVYCLDGIRNVIDAKAFSGAATFRQYSPKAVYNGSSLDFYYDHEPHDGVVYDVRSSGILGDLPFLYTASSKRLSPGYDGLSESNMLKANLISMINLPSFYASTLISYIFPDWYDVYVSADGKVTIKCAVDATTVNFDATFYDFDNLYSTAC